MVALVKILKKSPVAEVGGVVGIDALQQAFEGRQLLAERRP